MADIAIQNIWRSKGVLESIWTFSASGVGQPLDAAGLSDKTVHVIGPTGGTGTIIIAGSNSPTDGYIQLTDPQGNALSFTNAGMEAIEENPRYIRPEFSGATGNTVQVRIVSRGSGV